MKKISISLLGTLSALLLGCETKNYFDLQAPQVPTVSVSADAGCGSATAIVPDSGVVADTMPAVAPDTAPAFIADAGSPPDVQPVSAPDAQAAEAMSVDTTVVVAADAQAIDTQPTDVTSKVTEAGSSNSDVIKTTDVPCKNSANVSIPGGTGAMAFATANGFGVRWYGIPAITNISYFHTYDWSGASTSDTVTLFNAGPMVGGKDNYLGVFYNDTGMARDWSVYQIGVDGKLGSGRYVFSNQNKTDGHIPFLSFDGSYFRLTILFPGPNFGCPQGMTAVQTGRISVDGNYLPDNNGCVGIDYASGYVSVVDVADSGVGKPVIMLNYDDQSSHTMWIMDFHLNSSYAVLKGDVTRVPSQVLYSPTAGYLLSLYQSYGTEYFLSPLPDNGALLTGTAMPAGFVTDIIDGNSVVSIELDQLSQERSFVRASATSGLETARVILPPGKSNCSLDVSGTNGKYVVTDNGCFDNGNDQSVEVAIVTCN